MAKRPNDDLFEGTTMTFGEHLDELRVVLFRAIVGLVIGFLLGLLVAKYCVQFIQGPLKTALEEFYLDKATSDLEEKYKNHAPPEMLETIAQEGLVPQTVKMEPSGILACLKLADPENFADVKYKPHTFVTADIIDGQFGELCARLKEDAAASEGSPGRRLWELMSSEQRRLTERVANQPSEDLTEQDQAAVVAMLNSLADNPKVHEAGDFRQSSAAKEKNASAIYEQLEQDKQAGEALDADQSRRLNKQLITSIYPGVLRAPRVVLVDVTTWKPTEVRIQSLGAHEAFMIWIKAAFVSGLVMASPWIFLQIWTFVGAGLYPHEKGYVYVYLPFSLMLFLAGASLAFFFVFEPVLQFLLSFNKAMDIDPDPRISEWISFVLLMPLGFGASFQLPLVMLFLNRIGIFSLDAYLEKWRIAVLVIFIISMFLTPADPISMLLMAVPLTILYFGGVALCRWMPRGRNPFADAYEP